jgi:hypothetical protein
MPRINIELPAAWGTPSSVMTDITNNRLSLYILHEPAPQSMALCCTLLASFDGWKLKQSDPAGREMFRGWNTEFPVGSQRGRACTHSDLRSNYVRRAGASHILPKSQLSVLSVSCVCVCVCVYVCLHIYCRIHKSQPVTGHYYPPAETTAELRKLIS